MRQPSEQDWAAGSSYPIIHRPLALAPGTRLGAYAITAQIGAGGMGEVYRARDTKLNRDVAIKVLPDSFASDADRLARFTREAQTLASLNHPNIAQIHGLEEANGVRALVTGSGNRWIARLVRPAPPDADNPAQREPQRVTSLTPRPS